MSTKALARATRCCSPPESSFGIRSAFSASPTRRKAAGTLSAILERLAPVTSRLNAMFSKMVLFGSKRKSWKTMPMLRRN